MVARYDPTFELTQFAVTLTVANSWRERAGVPLNTTWQRMVARLAPRPEMYVAPTPSVNGSVSVSIAQHFDHTFQTMRIVVRMATATAHVSHAFHWAPVFLRPYSDVHPLTNVY